MTHSKALLNFGAPVAICLALVACSGLPQSSSGGGTSGTFTIGGSITGLSGTGLVLRNNGTESLTILAGSSTFTFVNKVASGGAYAVTVLTQPSNPSQTCAVTSGSGTATANVTTVAVTCTTNPVSATIGGTVTNLAANSSVILQNNGGDSLTITANGAFTFKTPVTGPTDAYSVTVLTQPNSPNQICTVSNGSGTAAANVTNVAVNCVLSYTIGGSVTGLVGTGLVLQNSSNLEQLTITANGAFTFKKFVPTATAYTVTIATQPTGPVQTCGITPGTDSGTATANVTTVVVTCKAVTYSVGGNVVGLAGENPTTPPFNNPLTDNSFSLQNNLGNTLIVDANGPFTFATPQALNGQYNVSVFTLPSTQTQPCWTWNYKGVVTGNITNILVDCGHDDWTFIDGTKAAGSIAAPGYGSFPQTAPTQIPNPYTNTPGARHSAAGWTDKFGSLWLFGGQGWELAGSQAPDTLDAPMNDLWVCQMAGDQCQWQLVGAYGITGAAIYANAQRENQLAIYTGVGAVPGARRGAATWTDNSGNLWLFGGSGNTATATGLLNDLWEYNTSVFTAINYTNVTGQWTFTGGASQKSVNQPGIYSGVVGTLVPGARIGAVTWTDATGNFWLFGGYGFDGSSNLGFLNDLWEYTGGNWVFVSGSNLSNQKGIYGTQGMAALGNIPGGRQEAVGWADGGGNLWLFGGEGVDSVGTANGILNDLWEYNIGSNKWTYVLGAVTANQTGVYGLQPMVGPPSTVGAAGTVGLTGGSSGTLPGSRWGASGWIDQGGNFWLLGGWGLDSTGTNGNGALNDLWVYTPSATSGQAGTWTWIKGSNTGNENGIYGPMVRPYSTYTIWTPGGRSNATRWTDLNGQLWLFGGEGFDSTSTTGNGYLNDMWRYLPYAD